MIIILSGKFLQSNSIARLFVFLMTFNVRRNNNFNNIYNFGKKDCLNDFLNLSYNNND